MLEKVQKVTHVGLDCHRKFSTISGRDAAGKVVLRERLDHTDREAMRRRLGQYPKGTPVVLEGSFGWGWVSDELSAAGLEPHLAGSSKVAGWRKARGLAKNNKLDADLLSEVWAEKERWWEIWLAPPEVRDWREWLRYRMALVGMQTGLKNRIHALLHRHGVIHGYSDLFGVCGRKFLAALAEEQDVTLGQSARQVLCGYLKILEQVRTLIAQGTRQFRKEVKRRPEARRLMTLPGVSWILGYTILAEVGRIERFKSKRRLVRYSCLAPLADDSGEDDGSCPVGRHIGHAGRRTLKWAWIEAAHGAVRHGGRFKETFDRRTNGGKRDKNRGYITVANQLCKLAYVLWTREVDYTDNPPPRPNAKAAAADELMNSDGNVVNDSRSGTGQPDCTMAAAGSQGRRQVSL
jgi:transposase